MSITAASASEQAQLDEAAALARATVDAANLNAKEKARVGDAARQARQAHLDAQRAACASPEAKQLATLMACTARFKVVRCNKIGDADDARACPYGARCIYSHGARDRRRDPLQYEYAPVMCPHAEDCPNGEGCALAHSNVEIAAHPLVALRALAAGQPTYWAKTQGFRLDKEGLIVDARGALAPSTAPGSVAALCKASYGAPAPLWSSPTDAPKPPPTAPPRKLWSSPPSPSSEASASGTTPAGRAATATEAEAAMELSATLVCNMLTRLGGPHKAPTAASSLLKECEERHGVSLARVVHDVTKHERLKHFLKSSRLEGCVRTHTNASNQLMCTAFNGRFDAASGGLGCGCGAAKKKGNSEDRSAQCLRELLRHIDATTKKRPPPSPATDEAGVKPKTIDEHERGRPRLSRPRSLGAALDRAAAAPPPTPPPAAQAMAWSRVIAPPPTAAPKTPEPAPPPGCIRECGVTYGVRQLYDGSVVAGGGGASTASVAGFSLFSHGGFPPGRGTYRNAPTYAEAAVALELSESIEKLLLDDFDDEC